jgi:methylase of polypeptide subunit release factors
MKHPLHSFVTLVQPRLASHDEQHPPEHILDGSKSPSIKSKKIRSGVSTRFLSILKRKRSEKYAQQVYCYGKSWLPSLVASEQDRMDLQHFQTKYVLGGNYLVELDHPEKILDVGTGTGTWLLVSRMKWS